jgi:hypothetical protein
MRVCMNVSFPIETVSACIRFKYKAYSGLLTKGTVHNLQHKDNFCRTERIESQNFKKAYPGLLCTGTISVAEREMNLRI